MGGNALKNTNCIRVNLNLYNTIKTCILSKLLLYNEFIPIYEIPEKESFGDLDLLYEYNGKEIKKIVNEIFTPKEVFSNGNVLSFSHQINEDDFFQIDLIKVSNIKMAQFYFGYGELGIILGRILKKNNLTFGIDGLWINYGNDKIILSNDPEEICKFTELDYNKWKCGFTTKLELFDWIIETRFFDKIYFSQDSFNSEYKKTYNIRPDFKKFVDYVFEKEMIIKEKVNNSILDYIKLFKKEDEKNIIDHKIYINKLHQEKFNGKVFLQYTEPKNINKWKEEFKKHISMNNDFDEYLFNNSIEFINEEIKNFILNN